MSINNSKWVIPLEKIGGSSVTTQNFLWHTDNVYIMDNHRAAFWCWLRHLDKNHTYNLLHIDEHSDCGSDEHASKSIPKDICTYNIDQYLSLCTSCEHQYPDINWGNYLSLFLDLYGHLVGDAFFATRTSMGRFGSRATKIHPCELLGHVRDDLGSESWIVNIDIDYFVINTNREPKESNLLFSKELIELIFAEIRKMIENQQMAVLTIAMSPELTGGWKQSAEWLMWICELTGISKEVAQNILSRPDVQQASQHMD